jgi:hypothetical protein
MRAGAKLQFEIAAALGDLHASARATGFCGEAIESPGDSEKR